MMAIFINVWTCYASHFLADAPVLRYVAQQSSIHCWCTSYCECFTPSWAILLCCILELETAKCDSQLTSRFWACVSVRMRTDWIKFRLQKCKKIRNLWCRRRSWRRIAYSSWNPPVRLAVMLAKRIFTPSTAGKRNEICTLFECHAHSRRGFFFAVSFEQLVFVLSMRATQHRLALLGCVDLLPITLAL